MKYRPQVLVVAMALCFGCGSDPAPTASSSKPAATKAAPGPSPTAAAEGPKATPTGVTCTKFDAQAEFQDGQLHVSIETDLPPEVEVSLVVSREYFEKGNKEAYAVDYVDDESPVSNWGGGRDFEVSNAAAMETYSKKQEELAASGLAEPLDHFSDSIEVWLLVRLSEPKASGSCKLNEDGDLEKRWKFEYSLDAKPKPIETLDPEGLTAGDRFRLTKETPLMPDPDPAEPEAALEQVVKLVAGSLVEVKGARGVKGSKWYEVEVEKNSGWLNSTALIGQKLRRTK